MRIEASVKVLNDDGSEFTAASVVYANIPRAVFPVLEGDILEVLQKWNAYDRDQQAAKGKSGK